MKLTNSLFFVILAVFSAACNELGSASVSVSSEAPTRSATLNWAAANGVVNGYYLEQSIDNANFSQVQTVGNTTSAAVSNLSYGTTYYFRVRAYNLGGASPYSPVSTLVIPSAK